jgi:hypothetical protein
MIRHFISAGLVMDSVTFIEERYGSNWVVAHRKSSRIVDKCGEDAVVIHPRIYRRLHDEFEAQRPVPQPSDRGPPKVG